MASVKVCFAVGLLMTAFSTTVMGVTQVIPDDVVYTDVTKTLVRDNTGVLTCRFKGTPLAVYWKKISDPSNTPLLVGLHNGEKSGPRYEDGSCDIDENYSLVIKRVRTEDAGLYTCRVVSYKGNLLHNFTDVTTSDAAVKTRSVVVLQKGPPGVLPCEPIIRPKKISWLRSPNERLVTMEHSGDTPERSGPEYSEGLFNITEEYSLVIKDVMVMHEDRYICEVTDYDTDKLFQNGTVLKVFHFPLEPFPSIEECPQEQQNLSACTLRITSRTTLTCHVEGYYPNIDLFFVHESERLNSLETRVWNNSDGTKSKRVTISLDASSDTFFECVAAGLVGQAGNRSITIRLIRGDQQSHVAVAVAVPVILVSAIIVIVFLAYKKRKTHFKRDYNTVPIVDKLTGEDQGKEDHRGKAGGKTEDICLDTDGGIRRKHNVTTKQQVELHNKPNTNITVGQEEQNQKESAKNKLKTYSKALEDKDKCEDKVQNNNISKTEMTKDEVKKKMAEMEEEIEELKRELKQLEEKHVKLKSETEELEIEYNREGKKISP